MDARPPGIPDATWADYVAVLEPLRRLWPSREQWEIIKALRDGSHVLVNSVAGSGKTTTACFIAALNRERRCLLLTYNARLKEETRARRDDWRLGNLEVHSFHAAGVKYFSDRCRVDEGLVDVVHDAAAARLERPVAPFDVIIIDETQDVTPLLFAFLHHMCGLVVEARGPAKDPIQLVCVGDERQAIFGFRNADARFLRHADRLMPSFACRPWARCTLSTSYRVTPPMAAFINEAMLGGAGSIVSSKPPGRYQPVVYVTGNPWVISASLASYVAQQVHMGFQKPGDFIIESECEVAVVSAALSRPHALAALVCSALSERVQDGEQYAAAAVCKRAESVSPPPTNRCLAATFMSTRRPAAGPSASRSPPPATL